MYDLKSMFYAYIFPSLPPHQATGAHRPLIYSQCPVLANIDFVEQGYIKKCPYSFAQEL